MSNRPPAGFLEELPEVARSLEQLTETLVAGPKGLACVFNPWRDWDERDRQPVRQAPERRRENFQAYLAARRETARVVLMGEAPSHRGCRFTGIAFCSEVELLRIPGLVAPKPLGLTSRDAASKPMRERSAHVVWGELERHRCSQEVVLWNAFPWHPHLAPAGQGEASTQRCGPATNRRPKPSEVEQGRAAFQALLGYFPQPLEIFAVGRVAEQALANWPEFESRGCLRHPAQGGERLFREHFEQQVMASLKRRRAA